jgi:prophage tail gpP-like protein
MIDSSAVHTTGRFENKTLAEIAKEVDPAGLGITVEGALDKIPRAQITPGETAFQMIERLARAQGVTLTGTADGKLKARKGDAPRQRHAGGLFEGRNIISADAVHDWTGRHSKVTVRGQRVIGHGADALEIEAVANDTTVNRNRPLIVVVTDDTDTDRAKTRAKNHRDRAAGRSLTASMTVQGFRDEGGTVWEPGRLVWVESETLQIQQDMLLETATFEQTNTGGSTTRLDLVDPRAYGGQKGKGNKSGGSWSQDSSDAEDKTNG